MNRNSEVTAILTRWNREAERTARVLEALPATQYDYRPDPDGRSIGELAWHLCEVEACLTFGIEHRRFRPEDEPPGLKPRPREIALLAPGYRRIHEQALARVAAIDDARLDEQVDYFDGRKITVREVMTDLLMHHLIHHRAQLVLLSRMSGGTPPGLYGPNREEMARLMAG